MNMDLIQFFGKCVTQLNICHNVTSVVIARHDNQKEKPLQKIEIGKGSAVDKHSIDRSTIHITKCNTTKMTLAASSKLDDVFSWRYRSTKNARTCGQVGYFWAYSSIFSLREGKEEYFSPRKTLPLE